jgi:hypothetical protein
MSRTFTPLLLSAMVFACTSSDSPPKNASPQTETVRRVIEDTVRVVHYDTLRTIALDTIRVIHNDTVHTEHKITIYDTVRVITIVDIQNEPAPSGPKLTAQEQMEIETSLQAGTMSPQAMALITHDIPSFATVAIDRLDSLQQKLIATTFGVPMNQLERFRWGLYATPTGSPLSEHKFLTVWQRTSEGVEQLVITVAPSGELTAKSDN